MRNVSTVYPFGDGRALRDFCARILALAKPLATLRAALKTQLSQSGVTITSVARSCGIHFGEVKALANGTSVRRSERVVRAIASLLAVEHVGEQLLAAAAPLSDRAVALAVHPREALELAFELVGHYGTWHGKLSVDEYAATYQGHADAVRGILLGQAAATAALADPAFRAELAAALRDPSREELLGAAATVRRERIRALATQYDGLETTLLASYPTREDVAAALKSSYSTTRSARQGTACAETIEALIARARRLIAGQKAPRGGSPVQLPEPPPVTPSRATPAPPDGLSTFMELLPSLSERYDSLDELAAVLGTSRSTLFGIRNGRATPQTLQRLLASAQRLLATPAGPTPTPAPAPTIRVTLDPRILAATGTTTEDGVTNGFTDDQHLELGAELEAQLDAFLDLALQYARGAMNALAAVTDDAARRRIQRRHERRLEETHLAFIRAVEPLPGALSDLLRGQRDLFISTQQAVSSPKKK